MNFLDHETETLSGPVASVCERLSALPREWRLVRMVLAHDVADGLEARARRVEAPASPIAALVLFHDGIPYSRSSFLKRGEMTAIVERTRRPAISIGINTDWDDFRFPLIPHVAPPASLESVALERIQRTMEEACSKTIGLEQLAVRAACSIEYVSAVFSIKVPRRRRRRWAKLFGTYKPRRPRKSKGQRKHARRTKALARRAAKIGARP